MDIDEIKNRNRIEKGGKGDEIELNVRKKKEIKQNIKE